MGDVYWEEEVLREIISLSRGGGSQSKRKILIGNIIVREKRTKEKLGQMKGKVCHGRREEKWNSGAWWEGKR